MHYIIYSIENLRNGKKYIGVTNIKKGSNKRLKEHLYSAFQRNSHFRLHAAMRKYGKDQFHISELFIVFDKDDALFYENFFIEKYNSFNFGYNSNLGGYGLLYLSDETKEKMSQNNYWRGKNRSGTANPMFGKKHSIESIQKMAENSKGRRGRLGKKLSAESKNKISSANKGRPKGGRREKSYSIIDPFGNKFEITNLNKFCNEHDLSSGGMSGLATKRLKFYRGYSVSYINTDNN